MVSVDLWQISFCGYVDLILWINMPSILGDIFDEPKAPTLQ